MNGTNRYLVDTNMVIYYLNDEAVITKFFRQNRQVLSISVMTKMEVLSYPYNEAEDSIVRHFLDCLQVVFLDDDIIEKTIQFRRQCKIKMPDAIIAATVNQKMNCRKPLLLKISEKNQRNISPPLDWSYNRPNK